MLDYVFLGNTTTQWLLASGAGLLSALFLYGLKSLLSRRIAAIAARTTTRIDDMLADTLAATRMPVIIIMSLYVGSTFLLLNERSTLLMSRVAIAAGLIQAALWGDRAVRAWLTRYRVNPHTDPSHATSTAAIGFIVRMIVWTVFLLMILDNLGVDITTLVASLGIGGIAVALAVQNILGDLFASLSIVLDKPFAIGDFISVDDMAGTVEYVGLKTTRVRSLNGEQMIISNADLLGSRIHNLKRMESRRVVFQLGVTYGTPDDVIADIPELVAHIIKEQDGVRFDRAHFSGFGASSLDFEVVYTVNSPDFNVHMDMRQAIYLGIYRSFNERGIEFAFPTQTLHLVSARQDTASAAEPAQGLRAVLAASGGANAATG